jgi:NhaP-type Na+/H+ or K+/H+ antiporter
MTKAAVLDFTLSILGGVLTGLAILFIYDQIRKRSEMRALETPAS